MDSLIAKRKALKGQITRIENNIMKQPLQQELIPLTDAAVTLYIDKVQKLAANLDAHQEVINSKCPSTEFDVHESEYNALITRLEELDILLQNAKVKTSAASLPPVKTIADIKLPPIDLPKFGGNYIEWFPFHDLFIATVHNNASLSGAQKLHYLKNAIYGDAALLIQSIQLTDGNYVEAWDILKTRFHNTREIIDAHVKRLFNQPTIKDESASALRRLVDTTSECIRSLKVLKEPVQHWDAILIYVIKEKLDMESRRQWELSLSGTNRPKFDELSNFLEQRARALAASQASSITRPKELHSKRNMNSYHGSVKGKCSVCAEDHSTYRCPKFMKSSIDERWVIVKKHNLCFNCLRSDHQSSDCKGGSCKSCNAKHHTLLHRLSQESRSDTNTYVSRKVTTFKNSPVPQVLLPTAIIHIRESSGNFKPLRALLDSASQATFITEQGIQALQLKRNRHNTTIGGIGATGIGTSRGTVQLEIKTGSDSISTIKALILNKITENLPTFSFKPSLWSHIKGIKLADSTFNISSPVDVLLGADIYFEVVGESKRIGKGRSPVAVNTSFGWVLGGPIGVNESKRREIHVHAITLDEQVAKFWELEEMASTKALTLEEKQCERHFEETYTRQDSGRFMVRLPFKSSPRGLGDSRKAAVRRFLYLEKRLQNDLKLYEQYRDFMDEYLTMGHMELVPQEQRSQDAYYVPHHAVIKESSSTTKLRVVFDASAKTSTGISLNDILLTGPKQQEDLINLLLRFRSFPIVMTADIAKMYRQVLVHREDTDWQRIIWRRDNSKAIEEYRLLTVTYGTASAPYLATKVLNQLAHDVQEVLPLASAALAKDFYVDDLMTGVFSRIEGLKLQGELIRATTEAGLQLRKWTSNDPALLENLPSELRESQGALRIDIDEIIKTLGLYWTPKADHFTYSVASLKDRNVVTKRTILSDTSKIFDPLGLLSPVTIKAKILLQDMWQLKLDWDDSLPPQLVRQWEGFKEHLPQLEKLIIPRFISQSEVRESSLHGFSDASEKAYSAAIYLRTISVTGRVNIQLISAKTRVAPLKKTTLPRLELCGAVLLSKLVKVYLTSVKKPIEKIHCWTDSTIVLAWVTSLPQRWKTFVANRVCEVQEAVPNAQWHHVPGATNPADCASRGILANELHQHQLWWHGPQWLQNPHLPEDTPSSKEPEECDVERRSVAVISAHCLMDNSMINNYSALRTLIHVTAYMLRFTFNSRIPKKLKDQRKTGVLTSDELEMALLLWVRQVQREGFSEEYARLLQQTGLSPKSKLISLYPFIDKLGIIRVGGRLQHARISPDKTHPMLLPRRHKLTDLIINHEHIKHLHGGPQLLTAVIQRRFWIMGLRDAVRFHIRRCVRCIRQQAAAAKQLMGQLPEPRVNPARAFLNSGVDYAGPLTLRVLKGRGQKTFKAYIALFVCFTTRAIHLELVSDMSTGAFLAALKRFVARRGRCANIYSDCGTTFVGADRELKDFIKFVSSTSNKSQITQWSAEEGISWHFNPPAAPHFGGLWEAGVKSVKFHLKRVIGATTLTYEELQTLLCQVEACLNSRPLTSMSSDPNDLSVLTPGHFLIGGPITAVPEPDLTRENLNRVSRWELSQKLLQHFWKRWSNEYLSRLQQRPKWVTPRPNLKIGDLVLLKDENMPPTKWKMGRITITHSGADNHVRVVTVKTMDNEVKRPVAKLCHLPLDS